MCSPVYFGLYRILVFSVAPIREVHVTIDGSPWGIAYPVGGPLYVVPWDPSVFSSGLHTISVMVEVRMSHVYFFFIYVD